MPTRAGAASTRYLIDIGDASSPTTVTGWNNISGGQVRDLTRLMPLVDSTGAASTLKLRMTDAFNCQPTGSSINTNGTTASTLYPVTATRDSVFLGLKSNGVCTQDDTAAAFELTGLGTDATYDVRFYASRLGDTTGNRTGTYTIGTKSVSLNATANVNGSVVISGVTPTAGTIAVSVAKTSTASYAYLGVVEIVRTASPAPSPTTPQSPSPSQSPTTSAVPAAPPSPTPSPSPTPTAPTAPVSSPTPTASGDPSVTGPATTPTAAPQPVPPPAAFAGVDQQIASPTSVVTLTGVASGAAATSAALWSEVTSTGATIASPSALSTLVSDLAPGLHTFRLTIRDDQAGSATDDVTVVVDPPPNRDCPPSKIVVIGSSTAAGAGASPSSNSWVNRYVSYLQGLDPSSTSRRATTTPTTNSPPALYLP